MAVMAVVAVVAVMAVVTVVIVLRVHVVPLEETTQSLAIDYAGCNPRPVPASGLQLARMPGDPASLVILGSPTA